MQTLFIPDQIQIDLLDPNGNPVRKEGILIGIKTFATHKNNIDLSPFLSDQNGIVNISAAEIKKRYECFVSYGLMDYFSLESARPEVQIYYWGKKSLNSYIHYWTKMLSNKTDLKEFAMWGDQLGKLKKEFASIEKRERQELETYSNCYNRKTDQGDDVIIVKDCWDSPNVKVNYKVQLDLK